MKTATLRDFRNRYSSLLAWIAAGEEIVITRRGCAVARLIPEKAEARDRVDWRQSEAVRRARGKEPRLSGDEASRVIHEAGGKW